MPSSPISPVAMTISALPWKISASALTMSQRMVVVIVVPGPWGLRRFLFGHGLGFLDRFVDTADHVEGLLRQVVAFALDDHLEAADGFLQRHVFARRAGE